MSYRKPGISAGEPVLKKRTLVSFASAALLAVTHTGAWADEPAPSGGRVNVALIGTQGQTLGMASLEQTPAGVLISINASGLGEGERAFHIHERGYCDPTISFASAGGHFAPGGTAHGFRDAKGPHAGDMPNLFVSTDGKVQAQVLNRAVRLSDSGEGALLDADGSALVIHGGADDYASQPAGAAGPRVACAVIAAPKP